MSHSNSVAAKIVLIGSSGVGKTSVSNRFVNASFTSEYSATIGASFLSKNITVGDIQVKLQWDTAGQERFRSMTPMYYRGSQAAVIVFDVSDTTSFNDVNDWFTDLKQHINTDIAIAVVGNKIDTPHRVVTPEQGNMFVGSLQYSTKIPYFETSAKTGEGIDTLFESLARTLAVKLKNNPPPAKTDTVKMTQSGDKKCC
ncbi:Rab21/Rab5 family GTPase [Pelomyxa schiedti]|nr:Rab21/Rab5 family GTPase [Pelomyxa schiedti]